VNRQVKWTHRSNLRKRNPKPKIRIVTFDDEGREIDLHALRITLGTNLACAGVAPQLAQKVMRHVDYRTTLKHYIVFGLTDTTKAINLLPAIEKQKREAATETCDINPESNPQLKSQFNRRKTIQSEAKQYDKGLVCNQNSNDCKSLQSANLGGSVQDAAKKNEKPAEGIEPATTRLQSGSSTVELRWQLNHIIIHRPASVKALFRKRKIRRNHQFEGTEIVINSFSGGLMHSIVYSVGPSSSFFFCVSIFPAR
jgi:hypothetical protein